VAGNVRWEDVVRSSHEGRYTLSRTVEWFRVSEALFFVLIQRLSSGVREATALILAVRAGEIGSPTLLPGNAPLEGVVRAGSSVVNVRLIQTPKAIPIRESQRVWID